MKYVFNLLLVWPLFFVGVWDADAAEKVDTSVIQNRESSDIKAIKEVTLEYAKTKVYSGDHDFKVKVIKIIGNYAKAAVIVGEKYKHQVDGATAFLKKVDGTWRVTDMGTGATPDQDFPQEVW